MLPLTPYPSPLPSHTWSDSNSNPFLRPVRLQEASELQKAKPKEMKYAHKFHIVFMIFLFRLLVLVYFLSFSCGFSFLFFALVLLLYTFIGFPMGFGIFPAFTAPQTCTHISGNWMWLSQGPRGLSFWG